MEGGFESGAVSSGSSTPGGQGASGFNSGIDSGSFEVNQSASSINPGGMSYLDYVKDGVDKGYYKSESESVFRVEDVMNDAQAELERDEVREDWDLMDIPGTAHDKLSVFSEFSDEDLDKESVGERAEVKAEKEVETDKDLLRDEKQEKFVNRSHGGESMPENIMSFEQKIILLQAEAIKLLAENMNKQLSKKELEELIKKLKEVLNEAEKEENNNKAVVMNGVLGVMNLILTMTEQGYKKLEHEVKEVEK